MTGKEALNDLKKVVKKLLCNFEKEYTPLDYEKWFYKTKFDEIEKDLQVLDILKKLFALEYDVDFYLNRIEAIPNKLIISGTITREELDKIEEWLKDKEDI